MSTIPQTVLYNRCMPSLVLELLSHAAAPKIMVYIDRLEPNLQDYFTGLLIHCQVTPKEGSSI